MMRQFEMTDLNEINSWLVAQQLAPLGSSDISHIGVIVEGVACGFIISTDTDTVLIDTIVTNPKASRDERHQALEQIATWSLQTARNLKVKGCMFITGNDDLAKRAENMGFTIVQRHVGFLVF